MATKRFIPVSSELGGYFKTFFIIWVILFFVLFIALGGGKWGFWSGISVSFLISIPCFIIALYLTGVKE